MVTDADYMLPVQLTGKLEGIPVKGFTPRDTTRVEIFGGGKNYVHGGANLQKMVVPVIAYKNLNTKRKKYVEVTNAELKHLSESSKVPSLMFALDFFQRQPIGDKAQSYAYTIYMTDDMGAHDYRRLLQIESARTRLIAYSGFGST